jgi:pimeloyl-ACP methyl ester carboxylesterase
MESHMLLRGGIVIAAAVAVCLAAPAPASAQTEQSGYASVNGLDMYYEIHGAGRPLVLLHGALMTIEGFEQLLPSLAQSRQVIAIEQQAHGRTADIDRPFRYEQMADDTAALLSELDIEQADFFGYSMGGAIALQVAIRHPELVRKLVIAASAYGPDGVYPQMLDNIRKLKPEEFEGSPWLDAYASVAPDPEGWPTLLGKVRELVGGFEGWPAEDIRSIEAPALVIVADSDVVRPEHAVELFRLLGGGVAGDLAALPRSQLAVIPGTTHVSLLGRADWLSPMATQFLDAPMPEAK